MSERTTYEYIEAVKEIGKLKEQIDSQRQRIAELEADNAALRAEAERLREAVRYWSYCTWNGIRKECPELKNEFRDLCSSLEIAPYADAKEQRR